jgi:hypothetical protein
MHFGYLFFSLFKRIKYGGTAPGGDRENVKEKKNCGRLIFFPRREM